MSETRQQRRARERAEAKSIARPRSARPPMTEHELVHGRTAGSDTLIRLATSADVDAIAPLVELTGYPLDDHLAAALRADSLAGALRTGLREGHEALFRDVATAATQHTNGDLRPLYLRSALPLVAEHQDAGVVGTLLAYPPMHIVKRYYMAAAPQGPREQHKMALCGAISLSKVKAVAVAEAARGQHLGAALLQFCMQVYSQNQFALVYGQMPPERGLERFYTQQGFEVKEPGGFLDMWVIFGMPGGIYADEGERLFAKWLR